MMTNRIKAVVSKKKRRYQEDGFDLDLTYIYPNLIAMGFPAEHLEGVYRNHIDDVVRFLELKHKDHYKVYNLCSERSYDKERFYKVVEYPFNDHHPPHLELIRRFCEDLSSWLDEDEQNVAAVHCKAGKGRTGVMICSYILHRDRSLSPDQVLDFYGRTRTRNEKGVTIHSQRRFVRYYGDLIRNNIAYKPHPLFLHSITVNALPVIHSTSNNPIFVVYQHDTKVRTSQPDEITRHDSNIVVTFSTLLPICGNVMVEVYNKSKMMKREKMFHFWFDTFFVPEPSTKSSETSNGRSWDFSSVSSGAMRSRHHTMSSVTHGAARSDSSSFYTSHTVSSHSDSPPEPSAVLLRNKSYSMACFSESSSLTAQHRSKQDSDKQSHQCSTPQALPPRLPKPCYRTLTLNGCELDKVHKDLTCGKSSLDFKVNLYFSSPDSEETYSLERHTAPMNIPHTSHRSKHKDTAGSCGHGKSPAKADDDSSSDNASDADTESDDDEWAVCCEEASRPPGAHASLSPETAALTSKTFIEGSKLHTYT